MRLLLPLLLILKACSTTEKDPKPLEKQINGPIENSVAKKPNEEIVLMDPVGDWKKFFLPSPDARTKKAMSEALAKWPELSDPKQLLKKARMEDALGRKIAAKATLRSAIRSFPNYPDLKLELALNLSENGEHESAFSVLSEIRKQLDLTTYPDKNFVFKYRYCLGLAYLEKGDMARGQEIMSQLVGIDASFSPAYTALGYSYLRLGKLEAADFVAKRALERAGQNVGTLNLVGIIARKSGSPQSAIEWFTKAVNLDQNHIGSLVNRAGVSLENNDTEGAERDIKSALQIDPEHIDALNVYASILMMQSNLNGAKAILNKVIELDQNNADARFNMALILEKNQFAETDLRRLYQEVLQLSSESSPTYSRAKQRLSELKRWRPNL